MILQTHATARTPGGRLRGLSSQVMRPMALAEADIDRDRTRNSKKKKKVELAGGRAAGRPGCGRPGGPANDVRKAHERQLGSASGIT